MMRSQCEGSNARSILRSIDLGPSVLGDDRFVDDHRAPRRVDVGPAQRAHLAAAPARGSDHAEKDGETLVDLLGRAEQRMHLLGRGRPDPAGLIGKRPLGQLGVGDGVGEPVAAP
ncbi:MAG: hypothetical protein ACRD1K_03640, partial [Acidimicrobiales bacterium]